MLPERLALSVSCRSYIAATNQKMVEPDPSKVTAQGLLSIPVLFTRPFSARRDVAEDAERLRLSPKPRSSANQATLSSARRESGARRVLTARAANHPNIEPNLTSRKGKNPHLVTTLPEAIDRTKMISKFVDDMTAQAVSMQEYETRIRDLESNLRAKDEYIYQLRNEVESSVEFAHKATMVLTALKQKNGSWTRRAESNSPFNFSGRKDIWDSEHLDFSEYTRALSSGHQKNRSFNTTHPNHRPSRGLAVVQGTPGGDRHPVPYSLRIGGGEPYILEGRDDVLADEVCQTQVTGVVLDNIFHATNLKLVTDPDVEGSSSADSDDVIVSSCPTGISNMVERRTLRLLEHPRSRHGAKSQKSDSYAQLPKYTGSELGAANLLSLEQRSAADDSPGAARSAYASSHTSRHDRCGTGATPQMLTEMDGPLNASLTDEAVPVNIDITPNTNLKQFNSLCKTMNVAVSICRSHVISTEDINDAVTAIELCPTCVSNVMQQRRNNIQRRQEASDLLQRYPQGSSDASAVSRFVELILLSGGSVNNSKQFAELSAKLRSTTIPSHTSQRAYVATPYDASYPDRELDSPNSGLSRSTVHSSLGRDMVTPSSVARNSLSKQGTIKHTAMINRLGGPQDSQDLHYRPGEPLEFTLGKANVTRLNSLYETAFVQQIDKIKSGFVNNVAAEQLLRSVFLYDNPDTLLAAGLLRFSTDSLYNEAYNSFNERANKVDLIYGTRLTGKTREAVLRECQPYLVSETMHSTIASIVMQSSTLCKEYADSGAQGHSRERYLGYVKKSSYPLAGNSYLPHNMCNILSPPLDFTNKYISESIDADFCGASSTSVPKCFEHLRTAFESETLKRLHGALISEQRKTFEELLTNIMPRIMYFERAHNTVINKIDVQSQHYLKYSATQGWMQMAADDLQQERIQAGKLLRDKALLRERLMTRYRNRPTEEQLAEIPELYDQESLVAAQRNSDAASVEASSCKIQDDWLLPDEQEVSQADGQETEVQSASQGFRLLHDENADNIASNPSLKHITISHDLSLVAARSSGQLLAEDIVRRLPDNHNGVPEAASALSVKHLQAEVSNPSRPPSSTRGARPVIPALAAVGQLSGDFSSARKSGESTNIFTPIQQTSIPLASPLPGLAKKSTSSRMAVAAKDLRSATDGMMPSQEKNESLQKPLPRLQKDLIHNSSTMNLDSSYQPSSEFCSDVDDITATSLHSAADASASRIKSTNKRTALSEQHNRLNRPERSSNPLDISDIEPMQKEH